MRVTRLRARASEFSAQVTLYEAALSPVASSSPSATPPRKRSRAVATTTTTTNTTQIAFVAEIDAEEKPDVTTPPPKKAKSPAKTPFTPALAKAHPAPKRWQEAYDIIARQRETLVAAIDTMGCEQGGRDRDEPPISDKDRRLSTLVSLMLSSQTKDPVTWAATQALRTNLPGGLTVDSLLAASEEEIDKCICKVGFHNIKTGNLKKLAVRLRDLHGGDVPDDLPSLLAINGVGPKMSLLYLQSIGMNVGIGVDVHVHRITNRLGWHKKPTQTPEQTRVNLESWLPKELHPRINHMLVGFGQTICKPVGPLCDLCDVAKVPRLCPSKRTVSPKRDGSKSPLKKKRDSQSPVLELDEAAAVGREEDGEDAKPKIEVAVEETVVEVRADGDRVQQEQASTIKAEQLSW